MKKLILLTIAIFAIVFISFNGFTQGPPQPGDQSIGGGGSFSGGSYTGSGGGPVGGCAPIDGGFYFLLALSAGFGATKIYKAPEKKLAG